MNQRDEAAEHALSYLMKQLNALEAPWLVDEIELAIVAARNADRAELHLDPDTQEADLSTLLRPFEAFRVALAVLRAHFVEMPMIINSAVRTLGALATEPSRPGANQVTEGRLRVAIETPTLRRGDHPEIAVLEITSDDQLRGIGQLLSDLESYLAGKGWSVE